MPQFYIERLVVTGYEKEPSVIEFCKGLNLIIGPSNSGKSLLVEVLDYMFGRQKNSFDWRENIGYDNFQLHIRTVGGDEYVLERELNQNIILVTGTDPKFDGEWAIASKTQRNINDFWLHLIGIDSPPKIYTSPTGNATNFTLRTFLHMLLVKEEYTNRKKPVLNNPETGYNLMSAKTAAAFLLTGNAAPDGYEPPEPRERLKGRKLALQEYLGDVVGDVGTRLDEVREALSKLKNDNPVLIADGERIDLNTMVDQVRTEMDDLQVTIDDGLRQSRTLAGRVLEANDKLAEYALLEVQYAALRSQYLTDIERLEFIVSGEAGRTLFSPKEHCAFCDSPIEAVTDGSELKAVQADLDHLRQHLGGLAETEDDLAHKIATAKITAQELSTQKLQLDSEINRNLRPRLSILGKNLDVFQRAIELNNELDIIKKQEDRFSKDLAEADKPLPPEMKIKIEDFFTAKILDTFQANLTEILEASNYPRADKARFSMQTFDLVIGGVEKRQNSGAGYRGFLNAVVALAFAKLLVDIGKYPVGFLVLDTPFSKLKQSANKRQYDTLVASLLRYLGRSYQNANETGEQLPQIIITEHQQDLPGWDELPRRDKNIRVIEFTEPSEPGRSGFLIDPNLEDDPNEN